jgi:hypothetical protein
MTEDVQLRKDEGVAEEARQAAAAFQREMNGVERRRKMMNYITQQTVGHVDVLDPTGKAMRIDPSKVTVQKTMDFGLGRARPELLAKMDKKLAQQALDLQQGLDQEQDDEWDIMGEDAQHEEQGEENDTTGGKIWEMKLTKLEQQYMAEARQRQKENIVTVQKCWGREFSGQAFLANPAVIAFTDFEVGQRYKKVIQLTNVSLTFNQFKLLPLDDMISDFFEIEFQPPGRMSAGTTCTVTLWFTPKKNRDIYTSFNILSQTGPIAFPLQATTRKTILTMTPQDDTGRKLVDFGDVLRGEQQEKTLHIQNSGALPAKFELVRGDGEFVEMIKQDIAEGKFPAKSSTKIAFTFKPTKIGSFETTMHIKVDNEMVEDQVIHVRGVCVDVPIYVESSTYQFRTIVAGHVFRANVALHNRQSLAMRIQVMQPRQIEGELSYNPALAYIQGNSKMIIQFKLSPREDFLVRYPKFRDPNVENGFRIPVRIRGSDQELPVWTTLVGTLTTNDLFFDPPDLNFGNCFVDQTMCKEVLITNKSLLAQRFAFVRVPSYLLVQAIADDVAKEKKAEELRRIEAAENGDSGGLEDATWGWPSGLQAQAVLDGGGYGGFGVLLPNETIRLLVTWTPPSGTEMNHSLIFKVKTASLCAREFTLPCAGQGVLPALQFSSTSMQMAAIPSGAVIKESVEVTNTTKVPQKMNIVVPPSSLARLYVCPQCCTVEPRETKRIQFEFKPIDSYVKMMDRDVLLGKVEVEEDDGAEDAENEEEEEAAAGDDAQEEEGEPGEATEEDLAAQAAAEEERLKEEKNLGDKTMVLKRKIREAGGRRWQSAKEAVHCAWKLPVCVHPASQREAGQHYKTRYLSLRTCTVPHAIVANPTALNFKEVTVGQRVLLRINIRNMTDYVQTLEMESLPQNQCFTVLNALPLVKDRPVQVVVEFCPQFAQIYQTVLRLKTEKTRVVIPLKGKGVRPILAIEPEEGIVDFGAVTFHEADKDYLERNVVIKNASPYEMGYSLITELVSETNHFGVQPFTVTPGTAVVPGNDQQIVTVRFQPHRPTEYFRHKFLVSVPNQTEPTYFSFYGMCFKYQMYCIYDEPAVMLESVERESTFTNQVKIGGEESDPEDTIKKFHLEFDKQDDPSQVPEPRTLVIGACVPPQTKGAAKDGSAGGKFEFDDPAVGGSEFAKYFKVEPKSGTVNAGQKVQVSFSFNPPAERDLTVLDLSLDLLDNIGQWVSITVKGKLSGGYAPPGQPPDQEIRVNLRAYLCQL